MSTLTATTGRDHLEPGIIRSMSTRAGGIGDDPVYYDSSLRYNSAKRQADSEMTAAPSSSSLSSQRGTTDYGTKSGLPTRSLSIGQSNNGGPSKFSTVRRIIRQRSKSISSAMRRPVTAEVIPEVDEMVRDQTRSPALSSSHSASINLASGAPKRERKLSLFRRSKTPPQSRVDLEGVDSQKRLSFPRVIIRSQVPTPTEERRSGESFRSRSTPPTSPLIASRSLNGLLTSSDRANQMQPLDVVMSKVTRKSSEEASTTTPTLSRLTMDNTTQRPSMDSIRDEDEEEDAENQVTGDRDEEKVEEGTGVAYSTTASTSSPSKSVPKMWQSAESNHLGANSSQHFMNRLLTPSATSGSIASFRTAGSTPRARTPSRGPPKSPLSDLIYNLEQRSPDQIVSGGHETPTRAKASEYNPPPFSRIRHLEDDGESLESSQSSEDRRGTFGEAPERYNPNQWSSNFVNNSAQAEEEDNDANTTATTPAKRRTVGDMSMSEIEESLLAVEAALQDHEIEGSFDPNHLRKKMLTPRHASILGHDSISEEDINDFDGSRTRVRLPPGQQMAIQEAIKRVRRALSSSYLPQIPNEENTSEMSHGLTNETTPGRAARKRQESMQDVEEAYARMVDLVGSAAGIDLNALSPLPSVLRPASGSYNLHQMSFNDVGRGNLSYPSPDKRPHSFIPDFDQDISSSHGHNIPLSAASRRSTRQQLLRDSDALARGFSLGNSSREAEPSGVAMRGRPSQISLGSRRYASESPPRNRLESNESNAVRADYQQQRRQNRISVDGVTTSPSATNKTQGTPQSMNQYYHNISMPNSALAHHSHSLSQPIYNWQQQQQQQSRISSSPTMTRGESRTAIALDVNQPQSIDHHSTQYHNTRPGTNGEYEGALSRYEVTRDVSYATIALQKRHALERDSLLDMLDRSRNEMTALRMRNEELEADLHQEVTRVLEMQREMHRQRDLEQSLRHNEQMMQERIASLENELHKANTDRMQIAELLDRVQYAVDHATRDNSNNHRDSAAGGTFDSAQQQFPSGSTSPLLQEDLQPSARHVIDDSIDSSFNNTFENSIDSAPLLNQSFQYDSDFNQQEINRSVEKVEPAPHVTISSHRDEILSEEDRENQTPTEEAVSIPKKVFKPQYTPATKRFSHPAATTTTNTTATSRLPLLASSIPRSPSSNIPVVQGMTKSTSTTSTIVPGTPTAKTHLSSQKRKPISSPVQSRIPLADRFGESMIGRPRTHQKVASGSSMTSSTSPTSMRNLSLSSSSRIGAPRKLSNYTSTTGGDTSYTARTPETIDVTTLNFNDDEDSFS